MKLLFDLLPVLLFFVAYKMYGIYAATATAMIVIGLQISFLLLRKRKPDIMLWITFVMMLVLGGSTLLLHDEMFVKWKPTAVYWILSLVFAGSEWVGQKNLVQKMLDQNLSLPLSMWRTLNRSWVFFFLTMGLLNVFVIYTFDTDTWVNFKLFGTLILTLLFMVFQGLLIYRTMPRNNG